MGIELSSVKPVHPVTELPRSNAGDTAVGSGPEVPKESRGKDPFASNAGREKGIRKDLMSKLGFGKKPSAKNFPEMKKINASSKNEKGPPNLSTAPSSSAAYNALNVSRHLTLSDWKSFCENIGVIQELQKSGDKKTLKAAKKAFKEAHANLMSPSDFDRLPVLAGLKEHVEKVLSSPLHSSTLVGGTSSRRRAQDLRDTSSPRRAEDPLLLKFLSSLKKLRAAQATPEPDLQTPSGLVEPSDYRHQFSKSASQASSQINIKKYGAPISNKGGGDCLFHALAGRNLSRQEIIQTRGRVAEVRRAMPSGEESWNAQRLAAGLTQTPAFAARGQEMVSGVHSVTNEVLADFQSVPGMYAGEDELSQWTRLDENRTTTVVVIDSTGPLDSYTDGKRQTIPLELLDEQVKKADILLYRSGMHWEQLTKHPLHEEENAGKT